MRLIVFVFLCIGQMAFAQRYTVNISDEIKRSEKNSTLEIVGSDNDGIYYSESWMAKHAALGFGRDFDYGGKLVKADRQFKTIYSKDYANELKELSFLFLRMIGDDIFLFAKKYFKKDNLYKYYVTRVNKENGELRGDFNEFGNAEVHDLMNPVNTFFFAYQDNSMLYVTQESGNGDGAYQFSFIDKDLKNPLNFSIKIPLESRLYEMQQIQYTGNKTFILCTKEYEQSPDSKRVLLLKGITFWMYNAERKSLKRMGTDSKTKLISSPNFFFNSSGTLFVSAFYRSSSASDSSIGYCVRQTDIKSAQMTTVSEKAIDTRLISSGFLGGLDKSGLNKRFSKDAKREIENNSVGSIEVIDYEESNTDGSFTFLAEATKELVVYGGTTDNSKIDRYASFQSTYYHHSVSKDLIVIQAGSDGQIRRIITIPKSQYEQASSGNPYSVSNSLAQFPYYSSASSLLNGNKLYIILNDHINNSSNVKPGEKVQTVYDFENESKLYAIVVDLGSGQTGRQAVFTNDKKTILFPRMAQRGTDEFLIPIPNLDGLKKSIDFRIAIVTLKP